jgi:hypothetical protein
VIAHAAAQQEDPLVSQARESLPDAKMMNRIEIVTERELDDGNPGFGKGHEKRHEDPVVEAARCIGATFDPGVPQPHSDPLGQIGVAGGVVSQQVGVIGKSAVVVDEGGSIRTRDRHLLRLPMGRDDDDRLGHCSDLGGKCA